MKDNLQAVGVFEKPTQPVDTPNLTGHVLVVDDTYDICLLFAAFLRIAGVRSSLAENGQVAYEKVMAAWESGRPFDLVLMDIQMPRVDGIVTARRLREEGYTGAIVMHTANTVICRREICFNIGCDDYFEKPILHSDFIALVSKYLPAKSPSVLPKNSIRQLHGPIGHTSK